jgi:hypothetical protein
MRPGMAKARMPANEVVLEFGRRHRAMKRTLLLAVGAWGAVVASVPAVSIQMAPSWLPYPLTAMAVILLVPFYQANSRYRCPACGAKPVDKEGDETWTLPALCVKCGARLRGA